MKGTKILIGVSLAVVFVLTVLLIVKPIKTVDVSVPGYSASPTNAQGNIMKQYSDPPKMAIHSDKSYVATMQTTKGDIKIVLFASESPKTVNNFVFLAREGFYDNTSFHRIIKKFMIQGGDPLGNGTGGPGYTFDDEPITRDYKRGTIAMANRGPNTNGSQFFIMHADYPLDKNYVVFGSIEASDSASLKVLDAIAEVSVGRNNRGENSTPLETVAIKTISIQER